MTDNRDDSYGRRARIGYTSPTLTTEVFVPPVANHVPHLMIRYDQQRIAITPADVALLMIHLGGK